jgi:hypothetical protein
MKNMNIIRFICVFFIGIILGYTICIIIENHDDFYEEENLRRSILMHNNFGNIPEFGFVQNRETALKIAKAIWFQMYGKKYSKWMVYKVILVDDIWYIEGIKKYNLIFKKFGGGPYIKIDKKTGTILDVSHTG